ncbi:MAG: glycoside hydrolase TIM-barrel-like domain-containing protein, partial [Pseudomonadota bacterium]
MATLLLAAAGSAVGGAVGGSILGLSAAAIGQAAGAVAGALIDQRLLGPAKAVEHGRAHSLRIQSATDGQPVPRVWGRIRTGATLIWSTRFHEHVRTTEQGGKGGGGVEVREFRYTISLAVALCEGEIQRVGRIWADGQVLDLDGINYRLHRGTPDQLPDPKIEAVEGAANAPAYRGIAYLVFEDLSLEPFGNRIPQFNAEVFRAVEDRAAGPEAGTPLPALIEAVALSPGTGEFSLETEPTRLTFNDGASATANVNNAERRPDLLVALDQLEDELPACGAVNLIVSWFGTDLRCAHCRVEPRAEANDRTAEPHPWSVAGVSAAEAVLVGRDGEGRPVFGGTPSDHSVIAAIRELKARGLKVMLYPFLLMDIPPGNALPDPYGRPEQPPYPWRGRITLGAAPGEAGTTDKTQAAATETDAFFGTAAAGDFIVGEDSVAYQGPVEWTWSRFALHVAALGAAAGGVEAICIGSELRGLTTIRSDAATYPSVAHLRRIAAETRALLPNAKISYAADWSEYWGHQPGDGSGDRFFHLDPLWADPEIDFIGIDDYLPLSDWRHEPAHADAAASSPYALAYLQANMAAGEHYDWAYLSEADRAAQIRTPIHDSAHGEHWVFRPKDIRAWWESPHHDRPGGVRSVSPTAWVPRSKPIWLTETGCPAVDLGANMPNLFYDPKSSESALPPYSSGARDDYIQKRYLQAKIGWYTQAVNNPVSPLYGDAMIPAGRIYVWTWDARPFPDFPVRESVWSDGPAHQLGHWLNGRIGAASLADVVHEITVRAGGAPPEVSTLHASVHGYLLDRTASAREALQPLMLAYGFDAVESGARLSFPARGRSTEAIALDPANAVASDERLGAVVRARESATEAPETLRLSYIEAEGDYRPATAEARHPEAGPTGIAETSLALALPSSLARAIVERWLAEADLSREKVSLSLPPSAQALEAGDILSLPGPMREEAYRIERIVTAEAREIEAVRIDPALYRTEAAPESRIETALPRLPGPLTAILLDLPRAEGVAGDAWPHLAVAADPWPGPVALYRATTGADFRQIATLGRPA